MRGIARFLLVAFVLLGSSALSWAGKNFYDVLQVSKTATDEQIKRAYRKLAVKYHPDKNKGDEDATSKFAEISNAYEALSNPEKRKIYDRHGEDGLKQHAAGQQQGQPQDIFSQFFGGFGGFGGGFGGQEEEQTPKGKTITMEIEVTLKDLYLGRTFRVERDKAVLKPGKGTRQCNCKTRMTTKQIAPGMYQQIPVQNCESCQALVLGRERESLSVEIERGMKDGQEITFFEQGEPLIDGEPGDLKFRVASVRDPQYPYERRGDDLLMEVEISLLEALVGFKKKFAHMDGHEVPLESADITRPGQTRVIRGEGMPVGGHGGKFGDLHVKFSIKFPEKVSGEQKDDLRELFKDAKFRL